MTKKLNVPQMDWVQVALHGGKEPCFFIHDYGVDGAWFCGAAKDWPGHEVYHRFVSLSDVLNRRETDGS
jgi:hypothetical protein